MEGTRREQETKAWVFNLGEVIPTHTMSVRIKVRL